MLNRNSTFIHFWRFFPTTWLIEPPRLFDFGHFFLPTHYQNSTLIRDFRVTLRSMQVFVYLSKENRLLNYFEIQKQIPVFPYHEMCECDRLHRKNLSNRSKLNSSNVYDASQTHRSPSQNYDSGGVGVANSSTICS